MKIQSKIITNFLENLPENCKRQVDNIITEMLESTKYIDGSTIIYDENNEHEFDKEHYHNWECNPTKINAIESLKNKDYNDGNDIELTKLLYNNSDPNIELVKGDIQLGKRVHALATAWVSIYIYERPVLYLFRNLEIDKEQLQDDIDGTESWNFNIEWIKSHFNKFNNKFNNIPGKKYYDYRLPSLTDVKDKKVANKLSDKEYISDPKMIYMALMNTTDLETLNKKFYEYIIEYCEKVNITLIIDESDLNSPTAINSDESSKKDENNSKSEKLISKLVNKVAHTIHITGTAHPFFWNYTTRLSSETKTMIPVQKIFVMKRHNNYYGFMKKNINFSCDNKNLPDVNQWWSKYNKGSNKNKFDIIKDYEANIKPIITSIAKRTNSYNSFLISEERIQNNQIKIAERIVKDFDSVFIIVFHGRKGKDGLPTGLRLYFPSIINDLNIVNELQQEALIEKRLNKLGGIKGKPSVIENNYNYYDIDMKTKEFNIKMIYKVLARLFKKINSNNTIITITGKYGERGYSFTSDDYKEYVLHLTDQYLVSHSSYNCTDIFQRGRIQGKYTDKPNLTFWTTNELVEIINKYVDFITKIEAEIMSIPRGHKNIRELSEFYLLDKEFSKALGRPRQLNNLKTLPIKYDRHNNAKIYPFPPNLPTEEREKYFALWCKSQDIDFPGFINKLELTSKDDFKDKNGEYEVKQEFINLNPNFEYESLHNKSERIITRKWYEERVSKKDGYIWKDIMRGKVNKYTRKELEKDIYEGINSRDIQSHRYNLCYDDDKLLLSVRYCIDNKILPKNSKTLDILQKKNYKEINNNRILHSRLNYKFINDKFLQYDLDDSYSDSEITEQDEYTFELDKEDIKTINDNAYFFQTADGYVYHHDPERSLKNKSYINIISKNEDTRSKDKAQLISEFKNECIIETKDCKRVSIKKTMNAYNTWCEKHSYKLYQQLKDFKVDFKEHTGLEISKSNGIRGFQIELKIN